MKNKEIKNNVKRDTKILTLITNKKLSYLEIGLKFNLSKRRICDIANNNGIHRKTVNELEKGLESKKVIKYFKSGVSVKDILNKSDISIKSSKVIYGIFRKNNIEYVKTLTNVKGSILEKKSILKKIVDLYDRKKNPLSFTQISDMLNNDGFKTITNKNFSRVNVRLKYLQYKNI